MDENVYKFIKKGQFLRQQYAQYLQSSNGLGYMLAGIVYMLIPLLYWLINSNILISVFIISFVMAWTFGKGIIQRKCYHALGEVREPTSRFARFGHVMSVVLMAIFSGSVWMYDVLTGDILAPNRWLPLLIISALPLITWRYLRTWLDFVIGFYLWLLCAAVSKGQPLGLTPKDLKTLLIMGLVLFLAGAWSDLEYRRIVKAVKELRHGYI